MYKKTGDFIDMYICMPEICLYGGALVPNLQESRENKETVAK